MSGLHHAPELHRAEPQEPQGNRHAHAGGCEVIRQMEICRRYGISDDTWRRWRQAGLVPEPLDRPGRPRWRTAEIEAWWRGERRYFGSHLKQSRRAEP